MHISLYIQQRTKHLQPNTKIQIKSLYKHYFLYINLYYKILFISLARTPEIGQGLGRILSCGARKPEETQILFTQLFFSSFQISQILKIKMTKHLQLYKIIIKHVKKQQSVEPDYEYPFPSQFNKIKQYSCLALSSGNFGNEMKVNFWITYEILFEIDTHIECLKFLFRR